MSKPFPSLCAENEAALLEKLRHWSLANGLVMYPPSFQSHSANTAPVTIFPTPFPRDLFRRAESVQQSFNALYAGVVAEKPWLLPLLEKLAAADADFTGKLYQTYLRAVELGNGAVRQPLTLGIFRSDYMYDEALHAIKQVEFNTVSVSFGGLLAKIGAAHAYLNRVGAYDDNYGRPYYAEGEIGLSDSARLLAHGLAEANLHYNKLDLSKTVVLFVVQPGERNCFDQRHVEYALLDLGIKSYRVTLEEATNFTTVNLHKLYIRSTMDEVSVVYYRSGYSPADYVSERTWDARLHLENCDAIKCPSLLTQLSGAKKIQQVLTNADVVQKFMPTLSQESLDELLSTFVKIHPLDDSDEGLEGRKLAFAEPHKYVLKPQREGGGNNIYKDKIPAFLRSIDEKDWGAYILMELINPPTHKNKILRDDKLYTEDIISELGIFGNILFNEDSGEVLCNENAGYLLRSKFSSSDEGGVAAGFGCVDNVYLY